VKLTNGEIFSTKEPLQKLLNEKLPVKVSYGLVKLVTKLDEQFKIIETTRQGLIKKYGEPDGKGSINVKQDGDNWDKFVVEFNELMAQEVEVVFDKVKLPETLEIETSVILPLEKFIEV
jgi:hypothetical protein